MLASPSYKHHTGNKTQSFALACAFELEAFNAWYPEVQNSNGIPWTIETFSFITLLSRLKLKDKETSYLNSTFL